MDPNAALRYIADHMIEGDLRAQPDDVYERAIALREWLARGGFAPDYRGRERALRLALRGTSLYPRFFDTAKTRHATKKKSSAELDREIAQALSRPKGARRSLSHAARRKLPDRYEVVETIDGDWMILIDGIQTGSKRDRSGAGSDTYPTYEAAHEAAVDLAYPTTHRGGVQRSHSAKKTPSAQGRFYSLYSDDDGVALFRQRKEAEKTRGAWLAAGANGVSEIFEHRGRVPSRQTRLYALHSDDDGIALFDRREEAERTRVAWLDAGANNVSDVFEV